MSFTKSTKYGVAIVTLAAVGFGYVFTLPIRATGHDAGPSGVQSAEVVVYKTASCGCCRDWVSHVERSDLRVEVVHVSSTAPTQEQSGRAPKRFTKEIVLDLPIMGRFMLCIEMVPRGHRLEGLRHEYWSGSGCHGCVGQAHSLLRTNRSGSIGST